MLEPILVGVGVFTGDTIWVLTHSQVSRPQAILHPADLPETSAEDAQLWAAIQARICVDPQHLATGAETK